MAQSQPFTRRKMLISALMVGWLVIMLWGLQRKYDESDYRKVDELVTSPNAPWSLEKELLARHPGNPPRCEKELLSSFRGLVRLVCTAPGTDAYRFQVDLVRRQIRGEDPRSLEITEAVDRKRWPADTGSGGGEDGGAGAGADAGAG